MQVFEYMRQVGLLEESAEGTTSCSNVEKTMHAFAFRGVTELQRNQTSMSQYLSSYYLLYNSETCLAATLGTRLLRSARVGTDGPIDAEFIPLAFQDALQHDSTSSVVFLVALRSPFKMISIRSNLRPIRQCLQCSISSKRFVAATPEFLPESNTQSPTLSRMRADLKDALRAKDTNR